MQPQNVLQQRPTLSTTTKSQSDGPRQQWRWRLKKYIRTRKEAVQESNKPPARSIGRELLSIPERKGQSDFQKNPRDCWQAPAGFPTNRRAPQDCGTD